MRMITEHGLSVFVAGAAIGSIVTYWIATREKRIILRIREKICYLGSFHELTTDQHRQTIRPTATLKMASDQEVLQCYHWAVNAKRNSIAGRNMLKKTSPTLLAAETIICEKFFGLSMEDAASALSKSRKKSLLMNCGSNGFPKRSRWCVPSRPKARL
jgi:hypothetical protein